jgi:hypothetical protein
MDEYAEYPISIQMAIDRYPADPGIGRPPDLRVAH